MHSLDVGNSRMSVRHLSDRKIHASAIEATADAIGGTRWFLESPSFNVEVTFTVAPSLISVSSVAS